MKFEFLDESKDGIVRRTVTKIDKIDYVFKDYTKLGSIIREIVIPINKEKADLLINIYNMKEI